MPENNFPKNALLGEILIKRHMISESQLNQALEIQKKEQRYIGEILVRLGFLEERDIVVALIVQCNLPYIAIDRYDIDRNIIRLVPKEAANKYRLIPLDRVGDVLSVVMVDPFDLAVKAELQRLTKCKIAPFIATKGEIDQALARWYGRDEDV